jgi:dihydroneopterin aldolase
VILSTFRGIMDVIKLCNIVFYAHHGYYKAERELGQRFELDIEVECDLHPAAVDDDLQKTIDYRNIYSIAKDAFENYKFKLLETVAERIAVDILHAYPIHSVLIRVRKPHVPLKGFLDHIEIEIKRTKNDI